jgi:pyridoxine 5-phosphate synthase
MKKLGVNIDHVATVRQARGTAYPEPIKAARLAIKGGADQITVHLREDRRHIQDYDLEILKSEIKVPLNLEMAAVDEITTISCNLKPHSATIVPEKREELTTEGGLKVVGNQALPGVISRLKENGIKVSLFIDPEKNEIEASHKLGVEAVEFHTGTYCDAKDEEQQNYELLRLKEAAKLADKLNLRVVAGHGINYENIQILAAKLPEVVEYNIGHSIVARAIFVGIERAVREMKIILEES